MAKARPALGPSCTALPSSSLKPPKVNHFFLKPPPLKACEVHCSNLQDMKPGWLWWSLSFQDPGPLKLNTTKAKRCSLTFKDTLHCPSSRNSSKYNRPLCRKMGLHVYFVRGMRSQCLVCVSQRRRPRCLAEWKCLVTVACKSKQHN